MTIDHEPQRRHLIVGEQTEDVELGALVVGGDPSATRITVEGVGEDGQLIVKSYDLIEKRVNYVAPIVLGTPVIIQDPE